MTKRRNDKRQKTTATICDCGTTHRVPNDFVGSHDWHVCRPCAERKHREFREWFARETGATA